MRLNIWVGLDLDQSLILAVDKKSHHSVMNEIIRGAWTVVCFWSVSSRHVVISLTMTSTYVFPLIPRHTVINLTYTYFLCSCNYYILTMFQQGQHTVVVSSEELIKMCGILQFI